MRTSRQSAILVVVPPPAEDALLLEDVEKAIQMALQAAKQKKIRGQAVTPFLLERVSHATGGESLRANTSLLFNNARVAAEIAQEFSLGSRKWMV